MTNPVTQRNGRDVPVEPAPEPQAHVVTLTVDGQTKYSETLA